jgi:hypothetical protein
MESGGSMNSLFHIIVELFKCEWSDKHYRSFLNEAREDHKELITILSKSKGIYSFYNSELEIIYIGKTKRNLWDEMKVAYCRKMPHYQRYAVSHPHKKYRAQTNGKPRKIQSITPYVYQTAIYFSAYRVSENYIDDMEKFLIRIMPNDIVNTRMEGNKTISMPVGDEFE